ncbi:MAG: hypothetical protein AAF529_00720 [Pseudomonadota bacterium]
MKSVTYVLLAVIAMFAFSQHAWATHTIMVLVEDGDKKSMHRNSRVNKAVVAATNGELSQSGFVVVDASAVTAGIAKEGDYRRTRRDNLTIAKAVERPPLDIVVLLTTYVHGRKSNIGTEIDVELTGELVNPTGNYLDNFKVQMSFQTGDCTGQCLSDAAADNAADLGHELGYVLRQKIEEIGRKSSDAFAQDNRIEQGYTLRFEGFNNEEVLEVERELRVLDGYEDHKIIRWGNTRAEMYYLSTADADQLNGVIRRMLVEMGFKTRVSYMRRSFNIQRITTRGGSDKSERPNW